MKWLEIGKVGVFGLLLGIIFALPTLTATRLVGVLGVSTVNKTIQFHPVSDARTFVVKDQGSLTVSFVGSGPHHIGSFVNPTNQIQVVNVNIPNTSDPAIRSLLIDLTIGSSSYSLFNHELTPTRSNIQINLPPHQPVEAMINVVTSDPDSTHGTFNLGVGGF